jgi:CBS domain-containing protein
MTYPTVADVMTKDVVAVSPETSLQTVAQTLASHRISGVPVVDASGKAVGVISASDIVDPNRERSDDKGIPVIYYIENGWASPAISDLEVQSGCARDVMTTLAFTIDADASIVEASALLVKEGIHRLLVVRDDTLVGIVSTLDLLRGFVESA